MMKPSETDDRYHDLAEKVYLKIKASRKIRAARCIEEVAETIREAVALDASKLAADAMKTVIAEHEKDIHRVNTDHGREILKAAQSLTTINDELMSAYRQLAEARRMLIGFYSGE